MTVEDQEYSVTLKADNSVTINDGSQINQVVSNPSIEAGAGEVIAAPLGGNITSHGAICCISYNLIMVKVCI